ncbi:hypothetical protein psal_cds_402 [Pandoravirus salinus]|uniref:Rho binding incomplete domain containing protein n=1 Tax=Pandoravirus salinus TaxID=1349410 RepID=A0A291ATG2_9VIRU|nr:hypothetical protein psal_cds_402 [Pandoravirus salinus]ATE82170.1 hypothetical protein psal_cds_402 [Pandoravirus salinus]
MRSDTMSAPDRDPWRQRARRESDPGAPVNIWALDEVPATYRGAHGRSGGTTTTTSTDAARGRHEATTSDALCDTPFGGHHAYAQHAYAPGDYYEGDQHHRHRKGDDDKDNVHGARAAVAHHNDAGAQAGDDYVDDETSKTDILLPSTPSSSSTMAFSGMPSRLADASALPPPGLFDHDYDYYGQGADDTARGHARPDAYADVRDGATARYCDAALVDALVPTNGLAPVDNRWLRDPIVAAAEFARPSSVGAPAPRALRALPVRDSRHSGRRSIEASLPASRPPRRVPARDVTSNGTVAPPPVARPSPPPHRPRKAPAAAASPGKEHDGHEHDGARAPSPREPPPPLPLFNADGFVVPLARRRRTWQMPVCIAGQAVWVAVSTTRRTLTVSTHDLREARLRVPAADLVCSLPAKRAQLYCSDVVIPVEDPAGDGATAAIRARRFDFYVGRGRFASRVGLLGGPDRRSLFAHLRLPVDLFALRLDHPRPSAWRARRLTDDARATTPSDGTRGPGSSEAPCHPDQTTARRRRRHRSRRRRREVSWLALGAAAEPPEGAVSCALVHAPDDEKGVVALAAAGVRIGHVRFDFLDPLPAIVHAEVPGLCVPRELYDAIVERIASASGLFCGGASVERGRRALARAVARLPHLAVVLHRDPERADGGGRVRLDVPPWAYTLWHRPRAVDDVDGGGGTDDGGRLQLLISPLEAPERDDQQCMVVGAACFSRCVAAFSVDRGRAWFWSDPDDSDPPSTSDDDTGGDGYRP